MTNLTDRSVRNWCLLGAVALLGLSVACRVDMLLKSTGSSRPVLTVVPTEVRDSARAGSNDVRRAEIAITNSGAGTFTWSASDRSDWIRLDPHEGEVPATLTISLDPDDLGPGVYEGVVTIVARDAVDSQVTTIAVTFISQRPGLSVTPTSIERSTNVNSSAIFTELLQVTNSGTGQLNWTASKQSDWLTLSSTSGTGNGTIQVTINSSGLAGGTYRDDVVINAPGAIGNPARIPVTLTVFAPGLAVTPGFIRDTAPPGSTTPQSQTLQVSNSGTGTMTWSATKSQPWVTLSKTSGGAPDSLTVTVDPTGMLPGTQTDTVLFTSPEATNGPVRVPVELVIATTCNEIALNPDEVRNGILNAADCEAPHRPGSFANWYGLSANAGEGLSIRLTASFDAYLFLIDAAGNVLTQNDECPGETGTACIMDFPIATTGRYFIEATSTNPGANGPLTISVVRERAPTPPQGLDQFRADGNTSIGIGAPTPEDQVVFKGKVSDPNEGDARLEVELEPTGSPFTGFATHVSDYVAAGGGGTTTSVRAGALTNNRGYFWQARTCDRTGRCSAWLQFGNNADGADFSIALPGGSPPRPQ